MNSAMTAKRGEALETLSGDPASVNTAITPLRCVRRSAAPQ